MLTVTLPNRSTHPPIGAWVWGNQGIAYQVTRRFTRSGQYWLNLSTDGGPVEMPLELVSSWSNSPPLETQQAPPDDWCHPDRLSRAESLALILTDCRNLEELQIIKSHYGEEALKSAWQLLTQQQRAAITTIATGEQQTRSEIVAGDDWQPHPGDRVRCITKALGNRGGQESLEITAVNDDGSLMVCHSGWSPAIGSIAVKPSDLTLIARGAA